MSVSEVTEWVESKYNLSIADSSALEIEDFDGRTLANFCALESEDRKEFAKELGLSVKGRMALLAIARQKSWPQKRPLEGADDENRAAKRAVPDVSFDMDFDDI